MATIRAYTTIEQSRKLAEILPLESADMYYPYFGDNKWGETARFGEALEYSGKKDIPCWSTAALLEQLPYELCDDDGNSSYLQINKEDDVYQLEYTDPYGDFESIETDRYEHFVDACYEMIIHLHEQKIL